MAANKGNGPVRAVSGAGDVISDESTGFSGDKGTSKVQRVKAIRDAIRAEDKRLRSTYALLQHKYQDLLGATIFAGCVFGIISLTYLWHTHTLPTPLLVVGNALLISILHELEHDLIHDLYFRHCAIAQHAMFAAIWAFKFNASPWWRKRYHLIHHLSSGQTTDVEERLIGLGLPWYSLRRILVTLTPAATLLVAPSVQKDDPSFSMTEMVLCNSPMVLASAFSMLLHLFSLSGCVDTVAPYLPGVCSYFNASVLPKLVMFNFAINFPNVLRQMSLVIISTCCHYYGDVPEKDVMAQTQILDHWLLLPFQIFCFNFGATHILHHFVTRQPFYLRQLTAAAALPVLKAQGCRHNDMGSLSRANRLGDGDVTDTATRKKVVAY